MCVFTRCIFIHVCIRCLFLLRAPFELSRHAVAKMRVCHCVFTSTLASVRGHDAAASLYTGNQHPKLCTRDSSALTQIHCAYSKHIIILLRDCFS